MGIRIDLKLPCCNDCCTPGAAIYSLSEKEVEVDAKARLGAVQLVLKLHFLRRLISRPRMDLADALKELCKKEAGGMPQLPGKLVAQSGPLDEYIKSLALSMGPRGGRSSASAPLQVLRSSLRLP